MSNVANTIKAKATAWAGQLTTLAKSLAPNHVKPAISSHIEEKGEATFIIRITADRSIAPDARAQEYGSGLKARRGAQHKIPIVGNPYLVFFWEKADASIHKTVDGKVVLHSVQHPGIQAANDGKGYIAPAINELRARGRAELVPEIRQAILADIRRSFGSKS